MLHVVNPQSTLTTPLAQNTRKARLTKEESWATIEAAVRPWAAGGQTTRRSLERMWFISIAYLIGWQNARSAILTDTGELDPTLLGPVDDYIANHIQRIVTANVSRMAQARPDWDVIPRTPDHRDQRGAKVAQHLLDYYYDAYSFQSIREEISLWTQCTGNAFIRSDWNHRAGKKRTLWMDPFSGAPVPEDRLDDRNKEFLQAIGSVQTVDEGDMEVEVISPFQIYTPSYETKLERMPWLGIEYIRSVDWVWDNYPTEAKKLTVNEVLTTQSAKASVWWLRLPFLVGQATNFGFSGPLHNELDEFVRIREFWRPPSGRFPNGTYIVATDQQILEAGPHPYFRDGITTQRFPVDQIKYLQVPGRFWGMGLIEHLIGPQNEYNRSRSQVIQHRDILSVPIWTAPRDCDLQPLRNEIGDILEYDPSNGGKPELQNPPALSQNHLETIQRSLYDLQTLSAQSEATQAQVPTGVRSGVAIRALQEKDELVMGPAVAQMEMGFQRVARRMLTLAGRYLSIPRAIAIYGEYRMADIAYIKGEDLAGNYEVRIKPGSMMPKSKAGTQQTLMDMVQFGALNPAMDPDHQEIVLRGMEIGGTEEMFFARALDKRRAQIENDMFLHPKPGQGFPDVLDSDDPMVHLKQHELFEKTDAFELLPLIRKQAFWAHKQKHIQQIAKAQEAAMMLQALSQPAPSGSPPKEPGEASQPRQRQPTPGSDSSAA